MLPAVLSQAMCLPVERVINHALRQDSATLSRLARQEGRMAAVDIEGLGRFNVRLLRDGIALSMTPDSDSEVVLSGKLTDFLELARAEDKAHELINSDIDMDGDTELALYLTRTVQALDIDWESAIQPLTGGLLAHQIGKGLRSLSRWSRDTGSTYRTAAKEYLEDELQAVTPSAMLDDFATQTDDLRLMMDRIEARIAGLENKKKTED
ncbi:MAG: hypothetical protein CMH97_06400 [Oceanospirillaceae bacterium]|jgi:ubiquinone biosynthesis protein UbiJ|uniref:ubiquinone biosynthesis accessory factor UbiJ n=1 Tax=Thalassolituus sp. TaxID=2030822 RepID=UPI000C3C5326|nr:SCP2 sterol-binding domain-containing protein [Thalassolituus sp.]MAE34870.1 hypothetical protein [Oceanospirillaceae bacterium]MDQ4424505.1 SCP2 sterol-binding domain-containing protein [Thalassolituus sp.]MDQ4425977.1 SCP2 sterol-binding domain-containing protein [Thalassolituus sp.]